MFWISLFTWLLTIIGAATFGFGLYQIYLFLTFHFLPFGNGLKKYQRQSQTWALVTGSSAGIGFGLVQELASRGFGVIILAHKKDEVNEAAAQVKAEFPDAKVEKIVLDGTKATNSDIESALAPFMNLPITVLVNNLATQMSKPIYSTFESYKPSDISSSIAANNEFACHITRILYPVLKRNGPSLIVNFSSGAFPVGLPWLTVYCGTKAFMESWSKSLNREARVLGDPIDSLAILPGDVRSQGNIYGVTPGSPTARQFAKMLLDRVSRAISQGRMVFIPYWKHHIEITLMRSLPDSMVHSELVANVVRRKTAEAEATAKVLGKKQ